MKQLLHFLQQSMINHGLGVKGVFKILNQNKTLKMVIHPSLQLSSQISTFQWLSKAHTTKGWKIIAKTGQKNAHKLNFDKNPIACEEGTGAILHSTLSAELEKCTSVAEQIEKFSSLVSLSEEEFERRKLFCQSLEEMLKIYITNFKIHQFGSSVNGLGFKGCDMDVCLQTLFNNEDHIMIKEPPALDSVLQGTVSQKTVAHMTPNYMLRFVRRILRRHGTDIKEPILFINARCPILRFYNKKYDVFCDFSCDSENSLRNTRLLKLIGQLDKRFIDLTKVIRYWGKYGGFVGDIDMFNSYAFSLFVIHFLQSTNPAVLPTIEELFNKSSYLQNAEIKDVEKLIEDLKNFEPSQNTSSVEKLLRDFYFYYLTFDFGRVLLPYTSSSISISKFMPSDTESFKFGTVCIQDPFRHSYNATGTVTYKYCSKFRNSIIQACEIYQNSNNFILWENFKGLCSLFISPENNDFKSLKECQPNINSQIRLAIKSNAAKKIKNIFEYGLQFQCKEFRTENGQMIKIQCKAFKNTWRGRSLVLNKYIDKYENLELEHMISKDLIQVKPGNKREILCEFMCACKEIRTDIEEVLLLNLELKQSKYAPIVKIFLKEFIPHVYNKL